MSDMNVLEKILEEIEELKRNQDSKNQDFVTGYISALSTVEYIVGEVRRSCCNTFLILNGIDGMYSEKFFTKV